MISMLRLFIGSTILIASLSIFPFFKASADESLRWDMDKSSCVSGTTNIQGSEIKDGVFTGKTEWDPYFTLSLPSAGIQSGNYHFLTIRMFSSKPADGLCLLYASPDGGWCTGSTALPIISGWAEYTVDLAKTDWKSGAASGNDARIWGGRNGKISIIRIDPGNQADRIIKIDWVELSGNAGNKKHGLNAEAQKNLEWGTGAGFGSLTSWGVLGADKVKVTDDAGIEALMKDGTKIQSPYLSWDAKGIKALELGWYAGEEPGFLRMKWTADGGYSGSISAGVMADGWQTILFDLSDEPMWKGNVTAVSFEVNSDRNPDLMKTAYIRCLPEANIIPNADRKMKIPGKAGEYFGGWRHESGKWNIDIKRILPRAEYSLGVRGGKSHNCRIDLFDYYGTKLASAEKKEDAASEKFIAPPQTVKAVLSINDLPGKSEGEPVLIMSSKAPMARNGDYWKASWIWTGVGVDAMPNETVWFKKTFSIKEKPSNARILITGDDAFSLFVNGKPAGSAEEWQISKNIDVSAFLHEGENELLARIENKGAWGGLIAELFIAGESKSQTWILTDNSWDYAVEKSGVRPSASDFKNKAVSIGVPPVQPWGENVCFEDISKTCYTPVTGQDKITEKSGNDAKLADVKISGIGKRAWIWINGKKYPPLTFFPPDGFALQPEAHVDTVKDFASAGIHIHRPMFQMRRFWKNANEYDFSALDKCMKYLVECDPEGYFFLSVNIWAPEWWLKENPDEALKYSDGETRNSNHDFQSMFSGKYIEESGKNIAAMIRHIRKQPYASRIIGISPLSGQTNEWINDIGYGHNKLLFSNFSPCALPAYRTWLKKHYGGNVEKLRSAWNNKNVDFDNAQFPTPEERTKTGESDLLDPLKSRPLIDYWTFVNETVSDNIISLCRIIKEQSDGKWLAGTYYGYMIMFSKVFYALQESGHLGLENVLASPYLDFLICPSLYAWRTPGLANYAMMPVEALSAKGKLLIFEHDQRTFTETLDIQWPNGKAETAELSIGMLDRDFGLTVTSGMGHHWYEMVRKWYREPVILETVRREMETYRHLPDDAEKLIPADVCIVTDTKSPLYAHLNDGNSIHPWLVNETMRRIFEAGFHFDCTLVTDLLKSDLRQKHKLYIMLNTIVLSPGERDKLNRRFEDENATVLWLYAPGAMTPEGKASSENASATVGIDLNMRDKRYPMSAVLSGEWGGETISCQANTSPWFVIEDPAAVVVGKGDGAVPLVGYREMVSKQKWHDIFSSNGKSRKVWFSSIPNPSPVFLRKIAADAGVQIYSDSGDPLHIGDDLIFLHAKKSGMKKIILPEGLSLRPIIGPLKNISSDNNWQAKAGCTYGFLVEK